MWSFGHWATAGEQEAERGAGAVIHAVKVERGPGTPPTAAPAKTLCVATDTRVPLFSGARDTLNNTAHGVGVLRYERRSTLESPTGNSALAPRDKQRAALKRLKTK